MMMTRMSDDRDDHISRSKTNDPTRDTRESRGKARARARRRTTQRLLLRSFFILLFIFYIFSDETVVNNRIDFCFYVSR